MGYSDGGISVWHGIPPPSDMFGTRAIKTKRQGVPAGVPVLSESVHFVHFRGHLLVYRVHVLCGLTVLGRGWVLDRVLGVILGSFPCRCAGSELQK